MVWVWTEDGLYALKKVLIQSEEQLELVNQEIEVSKLFNHPNLLHLLDSDIIPVKVRQPYSSCVFARGNLGENGCMKILLRAWNIQRVCGWVQNEAVWSKEAYLLFPVHRDGTLLDHLTRMQSEKKFFPAITVLHIFQQVSIPCSPISGLCLNNRAQTRRLWHYNEGVAHDHRVSSEGHWFDYFYVEKDFCVSLFVVM